MEIEETMQEKLKQQVEEKICLLIEEGLQEENIETIYKLVDIHKDLANEDYWKIKEEDIMMYRGNYEEANYGRDNYGRSNYGRYEDNYGRRGARYRGEEMLDEMSYHYGTYHNTNNYGTKENSAFKMVEAFKEFGFSIAEELEPKEKMMFKNAMQEIMQRIN